MDALARLRARSRDRQLEWDPDQKIDLSFLGCELAGEAGELCNVIKKLERERLGMRGSRSNIAALAEELADLIIVADLIAARFDIDLGAAIAAKFDLTSEKLGLETKFYEGDR